MVTLTATDGDGESGSIDFYVVVDDGNDAPTGINLINDAGRSVVEVEVDEGDASGVVFGEITVDDIDDSMHPHGQHLITVSDDRFEIRVDDEGGLWLALKEGGIPGSRKGKRQRSAGNAPRHRHQRRKGRGRRLQGIAFPIRSCSPLSSTI